MIKYNDLNAIHAITKAATVRFLPGHDQCVASYSQDGMLLGGVIYTDYNQASIQMHTAGFRKNWLGKELLKIAFGYPFTGLRVKKVVLAINEKNLKSLAFARHLGFTTETRVKDIFVDGDLIVMSMYKSQCRFLDLRHYHRG